MCSPACLSREDHAHVATHRTLQMRQHLTAPGLAAHLTLSGDDHHLNPRLGLEVGLEVSLEVSLNVSLEVSLRVGLGGLRLDHHGN